jgi:hypothetical protein
MGIKSLSNSSGIVNFQKHQSMLAGIELNKFHHLETVRLASTTATVTFTNLDQYSDYQHLQLRMLVRTDRGASNDQLSTVFNNDTSASYSYHELQGAGSTPYSTASTGLSAVVFREIETTTAGYANSFNAIVADILDFSDTSKNTTVKAFSGTAGRIRIMLSSYGYFKTDAITEIDLDPLGNFVSGCRFSLYGLKVRA